MTNGFVRPGAITLIAVLQFIGGSLSLAAAAIYIAEAASGEASTTLLLGGILLGASGGAQLACGIGLWRLRPWGRTVALVFFCLGLLAVPLGTIIAGLLLYYLSRPGIKLMFSGRAFDSLTADEREQVAVVGRSAVLVIVIVVLITLCVVAVLGIVAAIAIPSLLRARSSAGEASAVASLRAIVVGQSVYSATCGGGFFAPSLARLGVPPTGGGSPFVQPDLAADPASKSGYTFVLTPGPEEAGAQAACNGETAGKLVGSYFISAAPTDAPGGKYFGANQDGTVYESTSVLPVTQRGAPAGGVPVR